MMKIRVRVKTVDKYGFNGREHHPRSEDIGQMGWVTGIELVPDEDTDEDTPRDPVDTPLPLQNATQVLYVALDTGNTREFMGHEIELVSCEHDGDL
jgi:hypothetical protein